MHTNRTSSALSSSSRSIAVPIGVLIAGLTGPASAGVVFVNASQILPTAFQTGNSWATAYKDLQAGLADAAVGDQVWVAQGTYKPTSGSDRTATFALKSGVKVLGGFQVGAALASERSPEGFPTILSGEIGGPADTDNSFHVVTATGVDNNAVLSGFIITKGNANVGVLNDGGGGLIANASRCTIAHCKFLSNKASEFGGAATVTGGGSASDVFHFDNCLFAGNSAGLTAGAVDIQNIHVNFLFCTIVGNNSAGGATGGVRYLNAPAGSVVGNCIIRDNTGGGTALNKNFALFNTTVVASGDDVEGGLGGTAMIDLDAKFVDADGADNILGTQDDNLRLRADSPCIDHATSTTLPGDPGDIDGDANTLEALPLDMAGNDRRIEDPLWTNAPVGLAPFPDCGAYEFARPRTVLVDASATGANNGSSWNDAYTNLVDALAELSDPKTGGDGEVWVANGTYKPSPIGDATKSFVPPLGVGVYGGFAGGEVAREQRDWRAHATVLSGEYGQPGAFGNARHVVLFDLPFYLNDTILDGFVVTEGTATADAGGEGGGIRIAANASPTIRNCFVRKNFSQLGAGAGMAIIGTNSSSQPKIVNCVITGNGSSAGSGVGAGAGIFLASDAAEIVNCTIAGNNGLSSLNAAGIHCNTTSAFGPAIRNCLLFANSSGGQSSQDQQIRQVGTGKVTVMACAIQNFSSLPSGSFAVSGTFFVDVSGGVEDGDGADDSFGTADDNVTPTRCSDLIDSGENSVLPQDLDDLDADGVVGESIPLDFEGNARRVDLPIANGGIGLPPAIDIGAIERVAAALPSADLNGSGIVDAADLAILLGAWATNDAASDLNGDCLIDAADLAILLGAWD